MRIHVKWQIWSYRLPRLLSCRFPLNAGFFLAGSPQRKFPSSPSSRHQQIPLLQSVPLGCTSPSVAQGPRQQIPIPQGSPEPQALLSLRFASAAGPRLQIPFIRRLASVPDSLLRQIRLTRQAPPSPGPRRVAVCVAVGCGGRRGPHGRPVSVLGGRCVCGRLP